MSNTFKIFTGSIHPTLAQEVAQNLGMPLSPTLTTQFSDGETRVEILESARNNDVFIIQPTCPPANDTLMELCILLDGFKRASVKNITAVIPYLGYARQDKKVKSREPITAKMVADFIQVAGATHVITLDVHSEQSLGFFDIPVDNIYATPVLLKDLLEQNHKNLVVVSPDVGGVVRARACAKQLGSDLAIIDKRRPKPNVSKVMNIIGEVENRTCVIIDDMVDTANTLCEAAAALKKNGAIKVVAYATHPILSGEATKIITESELDELVVTNTIPLSKTAMACKKIRQLSVAELLAETIRRISQGDSVSSLFME